jgi:arginine/lysine/ornithine decarboxylase
MSIREASFSPAEKIAISQSVGRILAVSDAGCPPAVPIVVSGEIIDEHALKCFEYYGTEYCTVIK